MRADLIIRSALVVDGTGTAPFTGDVVVYEGRIVEVGRTEATGVREIDAAGAMVAPGWVDIHGHYDGQATWDSVVAPSSWQGVTTSVMSNCGVGFAPVRPEHRNLLIELMEGVEDIPGTALHEGLPWTWETFGEYLDALSAVPHDIDIAAQLPHAPLRVYAMGEKGADHESRATPEELERMAVIVREAMAAGAFGFSTSRTSNHRASTGAFTPSLTAPAEELLTIARALGESGHGVLQVVTQFTDTKTELALMRDMMLQSGRPLSFSLLQSDAAPGGWRRMLDAVSRMRADGLPITAQVATRAIGVIVGLECSSHPFANVPAFMDLVATLPSNVSARDLAVVLAKPDVKDAILRSSRAQSDDERRIALRNFNRFDRLFPMAPVPSYEPGPGESVAAMALAAGCAPDEVCYDLLRSEHGTAKLYHPILNWADGNLDAVGEMLAHPWTVPGLGDGGAHVGLVCDASFPTTLLTHWCRDRSSGRIAVAEAVRLFTSATARTVGLTDRGTIAPGMKADLNVIDFEGLTLHRPEIRVDLPAGGRRLVQRASGYLHTFVSGVETYADGQPTGQLPGKLVRSRPA